MEANQVHVLAASVSCDLQQIIHAVESRFSGQIFREVGVGNRQNRVHDYVALIHRVTTAHLYMRTLPDPNAAFDQAEPDSRAKAFGEQHTESRWPRSFLLHEVDLPLQAGGR
jgi:triacylglycerol esterase/lipase EstA (alpha/beta hydrolase family)